MAVTVAMIEQAAERLNGVVKQTPLELSKRLSEKYQSNIYFKREDLQEVRSFKIRGAYNKIAALSEEEKSQGVVCASAGNHAQGVAYSCSALQIKGTIFMPTITPKQKVQKVKKFGDGWVDVVLVGETFDDSSAEAEKFMKQQQCVFVHPFNDDAVMAGQGTVGKEIYDQLSGKVDVVISSVGGGGLASGCMVFLKEKHPQIHYIGVEPAGAPAMYESLKSNRLVTLHDIDTFVDGAAVRRVGSLTFDLFRHYGVEVLTVPEGKVCTTMIELYQNDGIIAEPAGAPRLAAPRRVRR